jgi:hypothetical protein
MAWRFCKSSPKTCKHLDLFWSKTSLRTLEETFNGDDFELTVAAWADHAKPVIKKTYQEELEERAPFAR